MNRLPLLVAFVGTMLLSAGVVVTMTREFNKDLS